MQHNNLQKYTHINNSIAQKIKSMQEQQQVASLYPIYDFKLISMSEEVIDLLPQDSINLTSYILKSRKCNYIATLFLEITKQKSDYVLLFSHGNATDLGYMLTSFLDLAAHLGINIMSYDYSGYGQSTGNPSDVNAIYDIQCVYQFLVCELQFSPTKIILYGYSIGSGPSITLAANFNYVVGGLIVHSGLSSGLRVVDSNIKLTPYYDFFPNMELMLGVQCPVFILHGTADREISLIHAELLAKNCSKLHSLWLVENAGHSNIDTDGEWRNQYFGRVKLFIADLMNENKMVPLEELSERNKGMETLQLNHFYREILPRALPRIKCLSEKKIISELLRGNHQYDEYSRRTLEISGSPSDLLLPKQPGHSAKIHSIVRYRISEEFDLNSPKN